ncbi:transcriptional repressor [Mycobacterium simiae]|uniref:Transcriptional repressor n=1 Tax=Mycobacterium simiae TaxID=1784 RepID=A0A5B1BS80_MYCSI|nr:transcriptional repressor [Mycobacterium simiae]
MGRSISSLVIRVVWRDTEQVARKPSGLDPAVTERIGELLRDRGLRRMASRIQVLAVLEPVSGHLSVAEIHQRLTACLAAGARRPDLATVYRTVSTLVDQEVLHALPLDGGVTTYGLATAPHHHAVCIQCGAIIEVPARQLSSALEHAMAGSSFALSERAGLTLHGLCPACQDSVQGLADPTDPRPPQRRAAQRAH